DFYSGQVKMIDREEDGFCLIPQNFSRNKDVEVEDIVGGGDAPALEDIVAVPDPSPIHALVVNVSIAA
ncbi:hypothetical protein HAX54_035062, partial [Datura stramonium]|nr:hypothetical protein [Datura stramonium]